MRRLLGYDNSLCAGFEAQMADFERSYEEWKYFIICQLVFKPSATAYLVLPCLYCFDKHDLNPT